jgi:hypothetical protein
MLHASFARRKSMSHLEKLTLKSVTRATKQDPVQQRRQKLVAAIEEQINVANAALKGERYEVQRKTWAKNGKRDADPLLPLVI